MVNDVSTISISIDSYYSYYYRTIVTIVVVDGTLRLLQQPYLRKFPSRYGDDDDEFLVR